jgi:hypothetical protein
MSVAGVIVYRINGDGSLDGHWTHVEFGGATGAERATGGTPGVITGGYRVEIFDPENNPMFRGSLDIQPLGKAYSLTWVGTNLPANGGTSKYVGIGLVEGGNSLVASFQESV